MANKYWVIRNLIISIFTSLLIYIIFLILDFSSKEIYFSFGRLAYLHSINPLWYFFDLLLILVPLATFFGSKAIVSKMEFSNKKVKEINLQKENIRILAEKIRQNDDNIDLSNLDKNDDLTQSLIALREDIKNNKEEEELRRKEDYQRNWTTEGLAKFGEILRQNNDNIEVLSYNIIFNLVEYLKINQGGFFLLNDNIEADKHFELTACYAYSRKKHLQRRVNWSEGLIGACGLEQKTILLKQIPEDYINITSGLGEATPNCVILVPLKVNDEIHGVIELAAFHVFEKFEVDFIEKVAESIATTISSVKINLKTAQLLKESQEVARKMAEQENAMRQNLEELNIAREEAARQGEQLASFTESVNHTLVRAEYDVNGTLLYANTRFLNKLGYSSNKEIEGQNISLFINKKDKEWFSKIWNNLAKGGKHFEGDMKHVTKDGKDFWSMSTYTCVRNQYGLVDKILFLGIDTTEQKKQSLEFQSQIEALNRANIKVEFDTEGRFIEANDKFYDFINYQKLELENKTIFNLINQDDTEEFKTLKLIWDNVSLGKSFDGQLKCLDKNNQIKWLQGSLSPMYDMYKEISKIIFIANDITAQKIMEIESIRQAEQLKLQEEKLRLAQEEQLKQHEEFKEQTKHNIREIESVKIRNEKTLEGAMDAIVTINNNEVIELFNSAAEQLWKTNKSEIIGKDIRILLPENLKNIEQGEVIKYLKSAKNQFRNNRVEVKITDSTGEEIPVLVTVAEAKITENDISFTAFIQNISVELF